MHTAASTTGENPCCKAVNPHLVARDANIVPTDRDDDDYDIDFYTVGPVPPDIIESHAPQPSPREQLEVFP